MVEAAGKGLTGAQSALSVLLISIANCTEKKPNFYLVYQKYSKPLFTSFLSKR